jgi:hypothetical protein
MSSCPTVWIHHPPGQLGGIARCDVNLGKILIISITIIMVIEAEAHRSAR